MASPLSTSARFIRGVRALVREVITSRIPSSQRQQMSLSPSELADLIDSVSARHESEPATLVLSGDHCIVGDVHGNVDVLIRIFDRFAYPPYSRFLFLGDYIDRGRNSCEVILLLYALKFLYPDHVHLLRGNHEFFAMADSYGFRRECELRLSRALYERIVRSFDHLPIAARIGGNYCVHGGISPRLQTEEAIRGIAKLSQTENFVQSPSCDMLWSDPCGDVGEFDRSPRGCGVLFGTEAVRRFLSACPGANRIIRSHESCRKGFDWPFREGGTVLTVFSSCDYCDMMNSAAVVGVTDHDETAKCATLPPLLGEQLTKRRVIFPDWLIHGRGAVGVPEIRGDDEGLSIQIECD